MVQELPQQVHVVLGEEFQITCTATNDQDAPTNLMFSWEAPRGAELNETTTDEDDSRTASSTLHISSVTNNNNGSKYTCNVRNIRGGGVGTSFTLIVEGIFSLQCIITTLYIIEKSSRPTSFNITQVLTNLLQLTWSVPTNPRGSINYYNVCYLCHLSYLMSYYTCTVYNQEEWLCINTVVYKYCCLFLSIRCTTIAVTNQYKWSMLLPSLVTTLLTTSDHTQSTVYM